MDLINADDNIPNARKKKNKQREKGKYQRNYSEILE